uniref:Counting factor associated protein D n=1 Tax=Aceria tosichella TaxID=561515 RepID=A0A6G1SG74_9ACAR
MTSTRQMSRLAMAGLLAFVVIVSGTLSAGAQDTDQEAPPTPVFATNYEVHGLLSLPYAELNEPFTAYYDKEQDRSRTDYYDSEYQVYQFAAKSSPSASSYGSVYQFVYVPADFHKPGESRVHKLLDKAIERLPFRRHDDASAAKNHQDSHTVSAAPTTSQVKRVCFGVQGGPGYSVSAQTVLPDLRDFTYDSTGRCPHVAGGEHRESKCELWKQTTSVGDKKNVYKFWLKRDKQNSTQAIPVHYYMLGYDKLLGSHYDRYDISYFKYKVNGATDRAFELDVSGSKCGPMPGPGDSASEGERRARRVINNPIHEYVVEPHRYDHVDYHFEQFKSEYAQFTRGKYNSEQDERKGWFNFLHNLRFIHGHNRQRKSYKLAVNQYADENVSDLRYLRGRIHSKGYNGGLDYEQHHPGLKSGAGKAADQLPETFDWTVLGAVTPVKDQAICGSCWSFGTSGTVEGAYFVKTGKLLRLSQQQLVDCSWEFGNNGCDGGEDSRAYGYIMKVGGLSTEEDYGHYKAIDGKCHDKDVERPVKIKGFYNVTVNSVDALKHALVNYGPVSISIDASPMTFSFYSHGVYSDEKCKNDPDDLDHSVLAVGYTKIDGKLVWKVKNSWSTYWGNDGYIYIAADNNVCGVLDAPTVPIIDV